MKTRVIISNKKTIDIGELKSFLGKEKIRKEFFKLKKSGLSCLQCKEILNKNHNYEVSIRTLERWSERLRKGDWDLRDGSRRPKTIHYKVNPETRKKIIFIGNKTGWGEYRMAKLFPSISHTTIAKILKKGEPIKKPNVKKKNKVSP